MYVFSFRLIITLRRAFTMKATRTLEFSFRLQFTLLELAAKSETNAGILVAFYEYPNNKLDNLSVFAPVLVLSLSQ